MCLCLEERLNNTGVGSSKLDSPVRSDLQMELAGTGIAGDHRPRGSVQAEQQGDESAQSTLRLQSPEPRLDFA